MLVSHMPQVQHLSEVGLLVLDLQILDYLSDLIFSIRLSVMVYSVSRSI